jgi:hypothetical protein
MRPIVYQKLAQYRHTTDIDLLGAATQTLETTIAAPQPARGSNLRRRPLPEGVGQTKACTRHGRGFCRALGGRAGRRVGAKRLSPSVRWVRCAVIFAPMRCDANRPPQRLYRQQCISYSVSISIQFLLLRHSITLSRIHTICEIRSRIEATSYLHLAMGNHAKRVETFGRSSMLPKHSAIALFMLPLFPSPYLETRTPSSLTAVFYPPVVTSICTLPTDCSIMAQS